MLKRQRGDLCFQEPIPEPRYAWRARSGFRALERERSRSARNRARGERRRECTVNDDGARIRMQRTLRFHVLPAYG